MARDRTYEVGKEGICSECGEKKFIRASWNEKVFCDQCFGKDKQSANE
jgi:formylmethanofuran dehydrogenase subunit E